MASDDSYIDSFSEEDSCELVAIGFGLRLYYCGWITNGHPCNAPVTGNDVPMHLRSVHQVNVTSRLECQWDNCGDQLSRGCLVRHVQEKHLGYRWPCPKLCGAVFTRRGVMDAHRTGCNGTAG